MTTKTEGSSRIQFVDVLRLIALAQMVNGHTLHALLREDVRHGDFYQGYLWFRGLVSVAFMLVAGLAFHITTVARFDEHRASPTAMRRRVGRALEIIAIGFLLQLPLGSLLTLDLPALKANLYGLTRIDVLPCIGVSLLVLEALVALCKRPSQVIAACCVLALGCALLGPWGASLPSAGPIAFLTGWLGPQGGSQFPLLPFSGFVFAGVVLGAIALPAGGRTPVQLPGPRLIASGAFLLIAGTVLRAVPWPLVGMSAAGIAAGSVASVQVPGFVVQKLAVVTLAIGVLAYTLSDVRGLPRPLRILSGETLALYVFHLLVLYGHPINLHARIGESLSVPRALGVSALMLIASSAFGLSWHAFKAWQPGRRWLPSQRATVLASGAFTLLALALVASHAFADPPLNTNGTQYAIGGYDPVAYFEDHAAVRGKPELQAQYQGGKWLFSSDAHLQAWKAHPAHYAPAYGGHCAYAAAQGRLVTIDPQAWSIVNGRLFLNYSLDVRTKWNADQAHFIHDADAFWSKLSAGKK